MALGQPMTKQTIVRFASVLIGAAALFGLEHGLGVQLYIAIPAAIVIYMAVKVGVGLALGVDPK